MGVVTSPFWFGSWTKEDTGRAFIPTNPTAASVSSSPLEAISSLRFTSPSMLCRLSGLFGPSTTVAVAKPIPGSRFFSHIITSQASAMRNPVNPRKPKTPAALRGRASEATSIITQLAIMTKNPKTPLCTMPIIFQLTVLFVRV